MTSGDIRGPVLVLGGSGLIGAEVVDRLLSQGCTVRTLTRGPIPTSLTRQLEGATCLRGDAADMNVIARALQGCAHVVHAVGALYPGESDHDPGADVRDTLPPVVRLLEVLRGCPDIDLTYLSSGGTVYGRPKVVPISEDSPCNPVTSYGVVKLAAEKYIGMYADLYGISAKIARVANAYGPRQQPGRGQGAVAAFLAAAKAGDPIRIFGDGSIIRDYVHVADIALAVAACIGRSGGAPVINVGTGEGHSLEQLVSTIEKVSGVTLAVERLPARDFDIKSIVLDTTRLAAMVDWRPRRLEDGIRDTWLALGGVM